MTWLKLKISRWLLKHLFCAVTIDDIIEVRAGKVFLFGKKLTPEEIESLARQAYSFRESQIWEVLNKKVKKSAQKRMYDKSQSTTDLLFGKAMLYNLDVMEQMLERLSKM